MSRTFVTAAVASTLVLGISTVAYAVSGEFNNMCAEGLALHKQIETDCAINGDFGGKMYCFGSQQAKSDFMKNPKVNLRKAEKFYSKLHG